MHRYRSSRKDSPFSRHFLIDQAAPNGTRPVTPEPEGAEQVVTPSVQFGATALKRVAKFNTINSSGGCKVSESTADLYRSESAECTLARPLLQLATPSGSIVPKLPGLGPDGLV